MLLKLVWILIMFGGNYHQENAKNGSMPPDSPEIKSSRLRRFRNCLGYQKGLKSGYGLAMILSPLAPPPLPPLMPMVKKGDPWALGWNIR